MMLFGILCLIAMFQCQTLVPKTPLKRNYVLNDDLTNIMNMKLSLLADYIVKQSNLLHVMEQDIYNHREFIKELTTVMGPKRSTSQQKNKYYPSCTEALHENKNIDGVYFIKLKGLLMDPFKVYCEMDKSGKFGWLIFHRRSSIKENFTRNWSDYKNGFGNPRNDFFLGLELVYALTNYAPHELIVVIKDWKNKTRHMRYKKFVIDTECKQYRLLSLGNNQGPAGNGLGKHVGKKFYTHDTFNVSEFSENCHKLPFKGAWWINPCQMQSTLNGKYMEEKMDKKQAGYGIHWDGRNFESLKYAHMALHPVD